jgi:hypothetical protein
VVDTPLDDEETVLLHLETKTYFTLNSTGGHIWRGLKAGKELDQIVAELEQAYDVTREHAESSARELIAGLEQRGLVSREV